MLTIKADHVLSCWTRLFLYVGGNLANVLVVTQSVGSRYLGCHANASRQCLYVAGSATKCAFTEGVCLRGFDCSVKFYFNFFFIVNSGKWL